MTDIPGTAEHGERLLAALNSWVHGGVWPNFGPPSDAATAKATYRPATLARLRATSEAYDPDGIMTMGAALRQR